MTGPMPLPNSNSDRRLCHALRALRPTAIPTAAAPADEPVVKCAIFGAGGHARRAHAPNLRTLPGVEIVAIVDTNTELAQQLADDFAPAARLYTDGHAMLAAEPELDALFSVVPAFVRAVGVEAAAALKGVHLFSEKPQTLDMPAANAIASAVAEGGVVSSVGFRERYRPLFRAAKAYLADKETVHCSFRNFGGLAGDAVDPSEWTRWNDDFSKSGGTMFDWGCHAVDVSSAANPPSHLETRLTSLPSSRCVCLCAHCWLDCLLGRIQHAVRPLYDRPRHRLRPGLVQSPTAVQNTTLRQRQLPDDKRGDHDVILRRLWCGKRHFSTSLCENRIFTKTGSGQR